MYVSFHSFIYNMVVETSSHCSFLIVVDYGCFGVVCCTFFYVILLSFVVVYVCSVQEYINIYKCTYVCMHALSLICI